ncbi:MAG TPA: DNA polymerase III subunit gamma/tau [Armatimonadota bacterium]|jgi:DNA polymerase-3 subunit gamma/tau
MSYLSLYRKYRSQGFDEILGQKHVTQTLRNAISSGRVAHAYLFTGPRGTGKTSTARVLAKAMNCQAFDGPTPNPCGVCEACVRIRDGFSMDVMEIDAASTRGIDDIRDLREKVKFAPAQERVKVYVIDEVHQLTGEAFNALLKTLEEPPPNVLFVLATTELHKVPATIMSRCQRFDFRRGSVADLKERIESVCRAEEWEIEPEAVTALAIGANGGYRDSLGLLEQVEAYTSGRAAITLNDVNLVLGSVADDQLLEAVDAIASKDAAGCFRVADTALAGGVEVRNFLSGLRRRLRDLLMIAVGADSEDAGVLASQKDRLQEQSKSISTSDLLWCIDQLNEAERDLRWAPQQRLLLETTLVRLATREREPAPAAVAAAPAAAPPRPRPEPAVSRSRPEPAAQRAERPAPAARVAPPPADMDDDDEPPMDEPPDVGGRGYDDMAALSQGWQAMLRGLKGGAQTMLRGSRPLRMEGTILVIGVPEQVWAEKAQGRREKMEEVFRQASGRNVPLKFVHHGAPDTTRPAAPKAHRPTPPPAKSLSDLAVQLFEGDLVPDEDANPFEE